MQITDIADAMIVGRLFQLLFDRGVCVVTTSNRVPDDLYKDGLNRPLFLPFIALLKDRLEVMALDSDTDYRQHRLQGAQVYFTPAGHAAKAAIQKIWQELSGGGGDGALVAAPRCLRARVDHDLRRLRRPLGRPAGRVKSHGR